MVADQVITLVHLEQAEVVRKGDQVVISPRSGTSNVRMPGEALSNGGMSEQIRVKNLNSNGSSRLKSSRRVRWKSPCRCSEKTGADPFVP